VLQVGRNPDLGQKPFYAERGGQIVGFIVRACADQARLMDMGAPARSLLSVDDFTLNLIDTALAVLQAPTSVQPT
jgi:hypothetical protein